MDYALTQYLEFVWVETDNAHSLIFDSAVPQKVQDLNHFNQPTQDKQLEYDIPGDKEMPGDKEIHEDPPQDTIGGLTWDVLRLQIRDPAFKLNEFFVSNLNYLLIRPTGIATPK